MATRRQRKSKQKLAKQKQEENKKRNTAQSDNFNQELDFNDISELDGIKAYVLLKLSKVINSLKSGEEDGIKIIETANELKRLAEEPEKSYNEYIESNKDKISKKNLSRIKCILKNSKYSLNTTERALLETQMRAISMEYAMKNLDYETIDYGAIRVCFELSYEAIFEGLEEKKINSLDIYVGYGDTLSGFKATYEDTAEKYDLSKHIFLMPKWHSLDELYNEYTVYKHKYVNFKESSLNSLATAYATQKEYETRTSGRELLSYNGIALNYFSVLEVELKKLIVQNFNVEHNKLKLFDAINYLSKSEFVGLSAEGVIKQLHEIRELRNKVAHGYTISEYECQNIYRTLISGQILQFISWNLANKNNDDPIYQLKQGYKFANGIGVEKNYNTALQWFKKAAEQGNTEAQNWIGAMYEKELGVEKNYKEALKWYRKAADQGDANGQYNIGYMYMEGLGVEKNYEEAVKWYLKAGNQGDAEAQSWLGYLYREGLGVERNYEEAVKWYKKAAEQGNDISQNWLGYLYKEGLGVKRNYKEALKWYKKSANQQNVSSQNGLGEIYLEGLGVERNYEEAVKWYGKAAEQGNDISQNCLGYLYKEGLGVKRNYKEALKWYRKAADQENDNSQACLGQMYLEGLGVERNYKEALKWYRKAAEKGNDGAENCLGYMYAQGLGVEKNYEEALKWFRKSAAQGNIASLQSIETLNIIMNNKYNQYSIKTLRY
ncbi:SEL1-like repeat protein [Clostridium tyrobutyricum]|uniref:SEL1-like repeat protein n=1 Tax=Clostridium tyrobutyricum TaxID=1519 RepID=UPI00073D9707|nr:SEL1-like repeat protein [Clostridium tyrobutyricum]